MTKADFYNMFEGEVHLLPSLGGWGDSEDVNEEVQRSGEIISMLILCAYKSKDITRAEYNTASKVLGNILACTEKALSVTDIDDEYRDRIISAMAEAHYSFNEIDSDEDSDYLVFDSIGVRMTFDDGWTGVAEWLDGVIFNDEEVAEAVYNTLHPEE